MAGYIVYDGDCPFCRNYIHLVRLRATAGPVALVNARDGGPEAAEVLREGYDLDRGMVLKYAGSYYHGADCLHMLAMMAAEGGIPGRLSQWIFRSPARARRLYPWLRLARNAMLVVLRRPRLRNDPHLHPPPPR